MVIRTRMCRKHLWNSIPVLTQYTNWSLTPYKEEGRECAFDCQQEAKYQIRKEQEDGTN